MSDDLARDPLNAYIDLYKVSLELGSIARRYEFTELERKRLDGFARDIDRFGQEMVPPRSDFHQYRSAIQEGIREDSR